jgi:hypothetical protein
MFKDEILKNQLTIKTLKKINQSKLIKPLQTESYE